MFLRGEINNYVSCFTDSLKSTCTKDLTGPSILLWSLGIWDAKMINWFAHLMTEVGQ